MVTGDKGSRQPGTGSRKQEAGYRGQVSGSGYKDQAQTGRCFVGRIPKP